MAYLDTNIPLVPGQDSSSIMELNGMYGMNQNGMNGGMNSGGTTLLGPGSLRQSYSESLSDCNGEGTSLNWGTLQYFDASAASSCMHSTVTPSLIPSAATSDPPSLQSTPLSVPSMPQSTLQYEQQLQQLQQVHQFQQQYSAASLMMPTSSSHTPQQYSAGPHTMAGVGQQQQYSSPQTMGVCPEQQYSANMNTLNNIMFPQQVVQNRSDCYSAQVTPVQPPSIPGMTISDSGTSYGGLPLTPMVQFNASVPTMVSDPFCTEKTGECNRRSMWMIPPIEEPETFMNHEHERFGGFFCDSVQGSPVGSLSMDLLVNSPVSTPDFRPIDGVTA